MQNLYEEKGAGNEGAKMKKIVKLFNDNRTGPLMFVGLLVLFMVLCYAITNAIIAPRLVNGNFSNYTCYEYGCENTPTWKLKIFNWPNRYYCDEHKYLGERYTQGNTSRTSGGERTMGRCWICGKKGSFQLDGSYYCFEHYNDRLSGRIG